MEQIEGMTNRWFDETLSHLPKLSGTSWEVNSLIAGSFRCGRKYCKGIFSLLKDDHKLPAAALLRILGELDMKLFWCLRAPDKTDALGGDGCYQRFRRWEWSSLREHRAMFEEFRDLSSGSVRLATDEKLQDLGEDIDSLKKEGLEPIPNMSCICRELSTSVSPDFVKFYPMIYRRFSWAVHVDLAVIKDFFDDSGGQVQFRDDAEHYCKGDVLLHYCTAMGCDINLMVRKHYGWDCDEMLHEFRDFLQQWAGSKRAN